MAIDLFSLTGKIAVEYSDALEKIDTVSKTADEAAESLEIMSNAAGDSEKPVERSGNAAEGAGGKFSKWEIVLANLASGAIQSVIDKVGQLAQKIGELTIQAVGDYADYEQLVGGVETLFKESSDELLGYAETAYKTAGMSANTYMDTATGFAASLIQGLGGDTEKAVMLTNMAITDMSDNANKMGTDISSIQNAYQGFAKQNYTMLDNLKLGYGGTQEEMVRLINDSGILQNEIENLDGITFDQIIQAINKIQDNLGITGTTAKEAGDTISGSWSSVQALFENIMTKVGSELAPVVMGFLKQLSSWMETVDWDSFAVKIGDAFGGLLNWIEQIDFTTFFEAGLEGILSFTEGLGGLIDKAVSGLEGFTDFLDMLKSLTPIIAGVTTAIVTLKVAMTISNLISAVTTAWTAYKTANEGATIAQWLFNAALNANPIVLIVTLIAGLVAAIIALWNTNEDFRNKVIEIWDSIKTAFFTAIEAIKGFFTGLAERIGEIWESIKETVSAAAENIKSVISEKFEAAKQTVINIFTAVSETLSSIWETIKNVVQVAIMFIVELITAAFELITLPFQFIWENCKEYVVAAWEAIKTAVSDALNAIETTISNVWNAVVSFLSPILESIKNTFSNVWNAISSEVSKIVNTIKTTITNVWNEISSTISTVMNTIKTTFTNIWNAISSEISRVVTAIKSVISSVFNTVKNTISSILNSIKETFSSVWNSIKSTVGGVINGVKSTISNGLNGAFSTVSNVLTKIKDKFSSIFESAKNIVSGAIEKIKGFFDFDWSLPKIKLPHFSITGEFSLNPPSIPHFSIEWYKKAMEDGMIMNQPSIFGYNAKTNQFMAGGEAGSETVVGTGSLMEMIRVAVSDENSALLEKFEILISLLSDYFPEILEMMNRAVVLDSGALVGELAPAMDEELGRIFNKKGRG